jgi:hypothetical protein
MTSSACEALGQLSCLTCGGALPLQGLPRSDSLRCEDGHEVPFRNLVECSSPSQRDGLLRLLEGWRLRLGAIEAAADESRRRSIPEVADLYLAHAERFRGPIAHLLQAFAGIEE